MKLVTVIAFVAIFTIPVAAQDYLNKIPAFPSSLYAGSEYSNSLTTLRQKCEEEIRTRKDAEKQKTENITSQDKIAITAKYQNMSPDEIMQMQKDMGNTQAANQKLGQDEKTIDNEFNELSQKYQTELAAKLDPIVKEEAKLPDGEGTPDWAIQKSKELNAQYKKEYETITTKYFIGENAPFMIFLAKYKNFIVTEKIPTTQMLVRNQSAQANFKADEQIPALEAQIEYIDKCQSAFALSRNAQRN